MPSENIDALSPYYAARRDSDDILWCFVCSPGDPEMVSVFVIFTKQSIFDFRRK